MEQSKPCSKCKQIQPLTEYHKQAKSRDGLQSQCKTCKRTSNRIWRAEWRADNREAHRAEVKAFRESDPERARRMRSNNYQKHRDSELAKMAENYQANKEERQAASRANYAKNPVPAKQAAARRRAKLKENGIYSVTNKEWTKLQDSPCFICGSKEEIEIDHILPIDLGGSHGVGNLMPLCKAHNRSKHNKLWIVFRIKKGLI